MEGPVTLDKFLESVRPSSEEFRDFSRGLNKSDRHSVSTELEVKIVDQQYSQEPKALARVAAASIVPIALTGLMAYVDNPLNQVPEAVSDGVNYLRNASIALPFYFLKDFAKESLKTREYTNFLRELYRRD